MYAPGLHGSLFDPTELRRLLDDRARLSAMLGFEAALARAESACGLFAPAHATTIALCCDADLYDVDAIGEEAAKGGNPAIPLVRALTERVRHRDAEAARFVHYGATSQDVIDTATVLCVRDALASMIRELEALADLCASLADAHRDTVRPARTLLQQALPTSFGLEVAGWLDALLRHRERLEALRPRLFVVQFGGAAGTLASLGEAGPRVAAALAAGLDLGLPDLPWHTQRDRIGELAGWLAGLAGTLGKIAGDLVLSMQHEVAELFEPAVPGRGGSSTLPHKRNPIAAVLVRQAALRAPGLAATLFAAMPQEHERGAGGWHAEWETLADLIVTVGGALAQLRATLAGLEVETAQMRAGLELTRGLIFAEAVQMALAPQIGRIEAHERIQSACRRAVAEGRHLREVLAEDAEIVVALGTDGLERAFEPSNYLGAARHFIAKVLERWQKLRGGGR